MPPKRKIAPGHDKGFIGETKSKSKPILSINRNRIKNNTINKL